MTEQSKSSSDATPLKDVITDLIKGNLGNPEVAAAEEARKLAANQIDARHAVADTAEARARAIEEAMGGESMDTAHLNFLGELAIEARLLKDWLKQANPPENPARP